MNKRFVKKGFVDKSMLLLIGCWIMLTSVLVIASIPFIPFFIGFTYFILSCFLISYLGYKSGDN